MLKSLDVESKSARSSLFRSPKPQQEEVCIAESTVGIDIVESMELTPLISGWMGGRIDYVAWDFAGQLEYSTFHPVSKQLSYCFKSME